MKVLKKDIRKFIIDALVALSFSFFPTYLFSSTGYKIFTLAKVLFQILILLIILPKTIKKIHIPQWLLIASSIIPLLSTMLAGNFDQIDYAIQIFIATIGIITYATYRSSQNYNQYLKNTTFIWGLLLLINSMTIFLFKHSTMVGRENFYFLGNDNATIFESFTFIIYSAIYWIKTKKQIPISSYIIYLLLLATYFYAWSGNALAATFLLISIIVLRKTKVLKRLADIRIVAIFCVAFFTFFIAQHTENSLVGATLNTLGKDYTYTGRTVIWDKTIPYIYKKPILGNGYEDTKSAVRKFGFNKAHNYIYQTLYTGGALQLILVLASAVLTIKKYIKDEKSKEAKVIMILSILVFFIINSFDYDFTRYALVYLFILMPTSNHILITRGEK